MIKVALTFCGCSTTCVGVGRQRTPWFQYHGLARGNYLHGPKISLVYILRRNPCGPKGRKETSPKLVVLSNIVVSYLDKILALGCDFFERRGEKHTTDYRTIEISALWKGFPP